MKLFFVNNNGAGFADELSFQNGTTACEFFKKQMGRNARPEDYLVRVNRETVEPDYRLREGDRVSITPVKIAGA